MKKAFLALILIFAARDYAMDLPLKPRDVALCAAYALASTGLAAASGEHDMCTLALDAASGMASGAVYAMIANGLNRFAQHPLSSSLVRTTARVAIVAPYMPTLVGVATAMNQYLAAENL